MEDIKRVAGKNKGNFNFNLEIYRNFDIVDFLGFCRMEIYRNFYIFLNSAMYEIVRYFGNIVKIWGDEESRRKRKAKRI